MKWGDDLDEEEVVPEVVEDSLPERTVVGPDDKGVKVITEWSRNDKGQKVKTVRRVRVVTRTRRVSKKVKERRETWKRFGQFYADEAAIDQRDEETTTFVSKEDIFIESKEDQERAERENDQYGDQLVNKLQEAYRKRRMKEQLADQGLTLDEDGNVVSSSAAAGGAKGGLAGAPQNRGPSPRARSPWAAARESMFPPSQRAGGSKFASRDDDDSSAGKSNQIRINNITEDASEDDIRELCRPFGHVTRLYLAKDRETQISRVSRTLRTFLTKRQRGRSSRWVRLRPPYSQGGTCQKSATGMTLDRKT